MTVTISQAAPDVGFNISPTSINSTIAVGDQTDETVTLQNSSSDEIVVKAHVSASGDRAEPEISLEPGEVILPPGGFARVVVHIRVPEDAQPGRRLSSVLFDAASASTRDVSIVGQVGVAISTEVIHPVSDVSWSFPRIVDSMDQVTFWMEGRNTGNFTTRLEGTAIISGIFEGNNSLLAASDPVAVGESASLQAVWDEVPLFAIKKVKLDLSSGVGSPVERQAYILIFPWKLLLMLALMAAIAAVGARFQPSLAKVFSRNGRKVD
ncbi:MAG: hypothetical protein HZB44_09370 [Actinobacteria bacterium]|nr:hypothetical protein [Actinomycetota bacterium]